MLREDEAAGVPMEQRYLQFALKGADVPADGRLVQAEMFARARETSRLGHLVE
jgi:hypothetical protein